MALLTLSLLAREDRPLQGAEQHLSRDRAHGDRPLKVGDNHLCPCALPQSPRLPLLASAELLGFSLGAGEEQRLPKQLRALQPARCCPAGLTSSPDPVAAGGDTGLALTLQQLPAISQLGSARAKGREAALGCTGSQMAAGSSKLPEFSCQDAQHCIPIPKKIQARGAGIAELEVWILLSCPAEPHTCCEDLPGSYLVNWEVRDVGCWIWGPRGFGDFHTACQGLPGLISVHPPLPALGMRKHRLVGAGSAPVPLKSQAGAPEHLGCAGHSTSSHRASTSLVFQTGTGYLAISALLFPFLSLKSVSFKMLLFQNRF